jgi:uncharacterized protein YndB with AHSA1/START domain
MTELTINRTLAFPIERVWTAVGMAVSGEYVTVEPPHKLVFIWTWEGEDGEDTETQVTVELSPTDDGTELSLRHERFGDSEAGREQRDQHAQGWHDCFDRLPGRLSRSAG